MLPWVPTAVGVCLLVGLLLFAILSLRPADSSDRIATLPAPPPPVSFDLADTSPTPASTPEPSRTPVSTPEVTSVPARPPATTPAGSVRTPSRPRPPRTTAPPPPAPAPPPEVTGRYGVVDTFNGGFIGEVRVGNAAANPRNWTVRLRFGDTVGALRAFWVDGTPQPALRRDGDVLVFTGAVPVGAGASVALRFHFDAYGSVVTPATCAVNGVRCTGL